jgi:prepilin-type N-terminal cleavage/methylation domain
MFNRYGMTLIELIVCLAIIAILASVCVPYKKGTESYNLETCSRELLSDLRLMQQRAMAEGNIIQVYFDSINNSYMIYSKINMIDYVYKNKKLPGGISFDKIRSSYDDNKVAFNEKGNPMPYPCTISLTDSSGDYRSIVINIATNYIYMKSGE